LHLKMIHDPELLRSIMMNDHMRRMCLPWDMNAEDIFRLVCSSADYIFLGCYDGDECLGMFLLHPTEDVESIGIHVCMLPGAYGPKAKQFGDMCIQWVKDKTAASCLLAMIPDFNRAAVHYVKKFMFREQGRIPSHWLHGFQYWDTTVYILGVR
jgi:RimJ/RimL family protein N-acetyltransferase